jgi:hypothetical protein
VLSHPFYFLGLVPDDFLFPKLKTAMKETRIEVISPNHDCNKRTAGDGGSSVFAGGDYTE